MERNEEVQQRIQKWEAENEKKLETLSREEWIEAMSMIMAMTRQETEDFLNHLKMKRDIGL